MAVNIKILVNIYTKNDKSWHSVNYPGKFASLSVIPVVIQEFTDGQNDQEGEDATDDLEDQLSFFCLL